MDPSRIKALIAVMAESDLAEMTFSEDGWSLTLRRDAPPRAPATAQSPLIATQAAARTPEADPALCPAPLAGILHWQPSPGAPPFVRVGQPVRAGEMLGLIEAMKVFNAVRAEHDGVVAAILAADGVEVEAGQPLLRLDPA